MGTRALGTIAALGALATATGFSVDAAACGGLFCSAAAPVEQTAERILFAKNSDDTITAIIEIQYQGPSEKFGWLLPMPGTPKVNVSAQAALDAIDTATSPQYYLEYEYGECQFPELEEADFAGDDIAPASPAPSGPDGIEVLDQGTAGPYDYVIISADPGLEEPAQVAVDWLVEAGYDVGDIGADVLRPYLAEGLNLVAFRLTKGNDVGSIRPVMLTYEGTQPSIPIRPTQVAAADDMGIRVFVLGEERAVSDNYLSLELNESRINWFSWQSNYDEVVSAAADEAGGHGFVTEYAGATDDVGDAIWTDEMATRWAELQQFDGDGIDLMMEARWPFRTYEGFRRAVEAATTLPQGVTIDEFASNPRGYEGVEVDKQVFLDTLDEDVVKPLQQAQELVDSFPYLSRLYTTLSPEEMVLDPSFVFNPDLDEVSNVHTATIKYECDSEHPYYWEAPWTISLPDGNTVSGMGEGNWLAEVDDLPAAATIAQLGSSEEGEVIMDNRPEIQGMLEQMPPAGVDDDPTKPDDGGNVNSADAGAQPAATDDDGSENDEPPVDRQSTVAVTDTDEKDSGCAVASVGAPQRSAVGWFGYAVGIAMLGASRLRRRRRA